MSSVCYRGVIRMNPEFENENFDPMIEEGYTHKIPKVYLEGCGEVYNRQYCFNWDDDSVVVVRDKCVMKYTRSSFVELLAKNEELATELFEQSKENAMNTYNYYKSLSEKCDF